MASFFWNVRGFNKQTKQKVVKNWVRDQSILFRGLIETRVKERKAAKIVEEVFDRWIFMSNYEHNRLGRLWIVWRSVVRMTPIYKSDQLITCLVKLPGNQEEFLCSFIYA